VLHIAAENPADREAKVLYKSKNRKATKTFDALRPFSSTGRYPVNPLKKSFVVAFLSFRRKYYQNKPGGL